MGIFMIFLVALGLSMDNFAVSLAGGCNTGIKNRDVFKCAFVFMLAHIIMLSAGWFGGEAVVKYLSHFDHWIAFLLLLFIGGKMIKESFEEEEEKTPFTNNNKQLLLVSAATCMDALAVGLTLSLVEVNFLLAVASVSACVFVTTILGFKLGCKFNAKFGQKAEIAGGVVLILIGLKILLDGIM